MSDRQKRGSFATRSFPAALLAQRAGFGAVAGPDASSFRYQSQLPPFASIMGQGFGGARVPPLARMAMATHAGDVGDFASVETTSSLRPTRGRTNEWYQEHCITCYDCKAPINAAPEKRGKQCTGCRKWFHRRCLPGSAGGGAAAVAAAAADAAAAATAAAPSAAAADSAADTAAAKDGSEQEQEAAAEGARPLFYHAPECEKVHRSLQGMAGEGPTKLRARSAAPQDTWRLLDFSTIKPAYRTAALLGGGVVAKRSSGGSGHGSYNAGSGSGAASRPLDDFLDVMELLNGVAEEPVGEVLEDSFGVLLKRGDKAAAAATFNLYGRDHARLQSLVTAGDARRRGHARALVQQLQDRLREAGIKKLVVLIEPGVGDPAAARRLFFSQGYVPASAEQRMLWRTSLPEYHRNLVNDCDILVKHLPLPAKRPWGFF